MAVPHYQHSEICALHHLFTTWSVLRPSNLLRFSIITVEQTLILSTFETTHLTLFPISSENNNSKYIKQTVFTQLGIYQVTCMHTLNTHTLAMSRIMFAMFLEATIGESRQRWFALLQFVIVPLDATKSYTRHDEDTSTLISNPSNPH